jgi:hypothetical protein
MHLPWRDAPEEETRPPRAPALSSLMQSAGEVDFEFCVDTLRDLPAGHGASPVEDHEDRHLRDADNDAKKGGPSRSSHSGKLQRFMGAIIIGELGARPIRRTSILKFFGRSD